MRQAVKALVRRIGAAGLGLVLLLLLAVPAASASPRGQAGGTAVAHPSIFGGGPVPIEELPWLVYLEAEEPNGGAMFCTGTVVAPRVVLTAGHCVQDEGSGRLRSAAPYLVKSGIADISKAKLSNFSLVSRVVAYPHFDRSVLTGDAGLLILASPVSAPAMPLASAADTALLQTSPQVTLAGWGVTRADARNGPSRLQAGSTFIQSADYCKRTTEFYAEFSAALELCAVDPPSFTVTGCFGDSGGPAIAKRADGSPVEVGIESSGGPECDPKLPNIMTRVDQVAGWVGEWIAAVEHGAVPPVGRPTVPFPRLSFVRAKYYAAVGLGQDLGPLFRKRSDTRATCSRLRWETVRCRVSWEHESRHYYGAVRVAYTAEEERLTQDVHYTIHWVDRACRGAACGVHTRTG